MASGYPSSLDTFATSSPSNLGDDDAQARNHAERHDDVGDAMNRVQAELGTDPAGAYPTVVARLNSSYSGYHLPMVASSYYAGAYGAHLTTGLVAEAIETAMLVVPMRSCTLDRIGVYVSVAASSGGVIRLGIREWDESTGLPSTSVLLDAGTVDATSTGFLEATISQAVTAGKPYAVTATMQGSASTRATCALAQAVASPFGVSAPTQSIYNVGSGSTTGALGTASWSSYNIHAVRIWLRTSA